MTSRDVQVWLVLVLRLVLSGRISRWLWTNLASSSNTDSSLSLRIRAILAWCFTFIFMQIIKVIHQNVSLRFFFHLFSFFFSRLFFFLLFVFFKFLFQISCFSFKRFNLNVLLFFKLFMFNFHIIDIIFESFIFVFNVSNSFELALNSLFVGIV